MIEWDWIGLRIRLSVCLSVCVTFLTFGCSQSIGRLLCLLYHFCLVFPRRKRSTPASIFFYLLIRWTGFSHPAGTPPTNVYCQTNQLSADALIRRVISDSFVLSCYFSSFQLSTIFLRRLCVLKGPARHDATCARARIILCLVLVCRVIPMQAQCIDCVIAVCRHR